MIRTGSCLRSPRGSRSVPRPVSYASRSRLRLRPRHAPTPRSPSFQVDPLWPKPLPNHWLLGSVTGVAVDAQDHIWVVHRGLRLADRAHRGRAGDQSADRGECCVPAPPVLEFDQAGTLVSHWGGPGQGYDGRVTPAGIAVDAKGNVWIAARAVRRRQRRGRGGGQLRRGRRPAAARRARAQVHARRQVPAADRQGRKRRGQLQHDHAQQARRRRRRRRPPTRSTSPTASATAASSSSTRDRRLQAPLGRLRREASEAPVGTYDPGSRRRSSSEP